MSEPPRLPPQGNQGPADEQASAGQQTPANEQPSLNEPEPASVESGRLNQLAKMDQPPRVDESERLGEPVELAAGQHGAERGRAGNSDEPPQILSGEVNPFAPSASQPQTPSSSFGTTDLPLPYWLTLAFLLPTLVVLIYLAPGLGIPGALALLGAAMRVPMLQLRLSRARPVESLPKPLILLLTSFLFILMMGAASIIAFCIVCIPTGLVFFKSTNGNTVFPIIFGFSAILALFVFISLFVLSLRLSV